MFRKIFHPDLVKKFEIYRNTLKNFSTNLYDEGLVPFSKRMFLKGKEKLKEDVKNTKFDKQFVISYLNSNVSVKSLLISNLVFYYILKRNDNRYITYQTNDFTPSRTTLEIYDEITARYGKKFLIRKRDSDYIALCFELLCSINDNNFKIYSKDVKIKGNSLVYTGYDSICENIDRPTQHINSLGHRMENYILLRAAIESIDDGNIDKLPLNAKYFVYKYLDKKKKLESSWL